MVCVILFEEVADSGLSFGSRLRCDRKPDQLYQTQTESYLCPLMQIQQRFHLKYDNVGYFTFNIFILPFVAQHSIPLPVTGHQGTGKARLAFVPPEHPTTKDGKCSL